MTDLVGILAALVFALAVLLTPKHCPRGWSLEGVHENGWSDCTPIPPPHCGEPVPPDDQPCPHDGRHFPVVIYCTGGARPITSDGITVGCQR